MKEQEIENSLLLLMNDAIKTTIMGKFNPLLYGMRSLSEWQSIIEDADKAIRSGDATKMLEAKQNFLESK